MKNTILLFAMTMLLASKGISQVPTEWVTAKTELTSILNTVNTAIQNKWDKQPYCTNFASNLILANSNRGYGLFTPDPKNFPYPIPVYQNALYAKIDTMLMAFDTMGFKAVDLTVQYPMFVTSFNNSQLYVDFYKNIAKKIKLHGFKLIVGCQATFVDSTFGESNLVNDIKKYYFNPDGDSTTNDTLEMSRYKREKLQMMQTIIDDLTPDYLTVEMEPQTQAVNLFHLIDYGIDSTISLVNYFAENLHRTSGLIGAGAGTWDDIEFFKRIAKTKVDYIDYHIYPPDYNYINDKAFIIDSIADANNKKLVIGESWCYKATKKELSDISNPVATSALIYSRDVFDYWESVDTLFVKAMVLLSQQSKVELVQFHWANVMFGQITYNPQTHSSMSPAQILNAGNAVGYQNMFQFKLSPVGRFTKSAISNICITSGVNEQIINDNFTVYPNPTQNIINFKTNHTVKSVSLFDVNGKMTAYFPNPNQSYITVPDYIMNGLYLLKFSIDGGILTKAIHVSK
ncbi:MAG: T9SS type A sorting domain-containing protein [Ignavibacteriae bacterium]|nr:T9SS type A sorting domain-containing protein [Ignavibacteriota bacterium]